MNDEDEDLDEDDLYEKYTGCLVPVVLSEREVMEDTLSFMHTEPSGKARQIFLSARARDLVRNCMFFIEKDADLDTFKEIYKNSLKFFKIPEAMYLISDSIGYSKEVSFFELCRISFNEMTNFATHHGFDPKPKSVINAMLKIHDNFYTRYFIEFSNLHKEGVLKLLIENNMRFIDNTFDLKYGYVKSSQNEHLVINYSRAGFNMDLYGIEVNAAIMTFKNELFEDCDEEEDDDEMTEEDLDEFFERFEKYKKQF